MTVPSAAVLWLVGLRAGAMKKQTPEPKTWGTVVAERNRAKANRLTDAQREQLMVRGLQLIYGDQSRTRVPANSR